MSSCRHRPGPCPSWTFSRKRPGMDPPSLPCPCPCSSLGRSGCSPHPGTPLEQREGGKPRAGDEPSGTFWVPLSTVTPHQPHLTPQSCSRPNNSNKAGEENPSQWLCPLGSPAASSRFGSPQQGRPHLLADFTFSQHFFMFSGQILCFHGGFCVSVVFFTFSPFSY